MNVPPDPPSGPPPPRQSGPSTGASSVSPSGSSSGPLPTNSRRRRIDPGGRERRLVRRKLRPGQPGTKRLVAEYGERLLCVRYRYDLNRGVRLTTAEIVVDESSWKPTLLARTVVAVRIAWGDFDSRQRLRAENARWDPYRKVWFLEWRAVKKLGLESSVDAGLLPAPLRRHLPDSALQTLGIKPAAPVRKDPKGSE